MVINFRSFRSTGHLKLYCRFLDCFLDSPMVSHQFWINQVNHAAGCKVFSLPLHHHPPARLSRCRHPRHPARGAKGGRRKGAHRSLRATLGPTPNDDILSWGVCEAMSVCIVYSRKYMGVV